VILQTDEKTETVPRYFRPSVFLKSNNPRYGPDSRAKTIVHMASYSPRYSKTIVHMASYSPRYSRKLFVKFEFRGLNETARSVLTVSMRLQDQFPRLYETSRYNTKMFVKDFIASMRPRKWIQQCLTMTPRDRIPWFQWHRALGFGGLNETVEILWHHGNLRKNDYWLSFHIKGNRRKKISKHHIHIQ
jgi:hypothetical protein